MLLPAELLLVKASRKWLVDQPHSYGRSRLISNTLYRTRYPPMALEFRTNLYSLLPPNIPSDRPVKRIL